jgi:hypothetical protein
MRVNRFEVRDGQFRKVKEVPVVVTLVEQLRSVDIDRAHIDDVIGLLSFGKLLRSEYQGLNYATPEWLDDKIRLMTRYVEMHRRDALELRLKEARAQQAALMTPTEKREKLAAEIAKMEQELAGAK